MIPEREQDGPDRYVEELATVSRASLVDGEPGGWTLLPAGRRVGVLYAAHFYAGIRVRGEVPAHGASTGGADRRLAAAGVDVDADPARHFDDFLRVGSVDLLPGSASAEGSDGSVCRGQAVDVEVRARDRTARDQHLASSGEPRRQDDHEFAGH